LGTALLFLFFRQVHVASIGGVLLLIPWFWYLGYGGYALLYAGICSVAYFVRILPDLRSVREIERQKSKPGMEDKTG
jgi:hypothetical protein